ncbi:MAG: glycosyltransferase [Magnetococcales bacterium]|nr:glycosyltransferase [Magnetococcales bacterium]
MNSSMGEYLAALERLDEQDQVDELIACAQTRSPGADGMVMAMATFFRAGRLRPAFLLAMLLANGGLTPPVVFLVLAVGGLVFRVDGEYARGMAGLRACGDAEGVPGLMRSFLAQWPGGAERGGMRAILAVMRSHGALAGAEPSSSGILLSICIPTYNRCHQLAATLDHLAWVEACDRTIEVIVCDNASEDDTPRVVLEKGGFFTCFRYIRQRRNIGSNRNGQAVMRRARGKFCLWMGDDDRLVPEVVLEELAYLERHDDIIVSYAPAEMWSTTENASRGRVFTLEEAVTFDRSEGATLFNFMMHHRVIAEWSINRTAIYTRVQFEPHTLYVNPVLLFHLLEYGRVRFQPQPFFRVVIESPLSATDRNPDHEGCKQLFTHLDRYRGGMEFAAAMALAGSGQSGLHADNRNVVMSTINDFVLGRISALLRVGQGMRRFIVASLAMRRLRFWYPDSEAVLEVIGQEEARLLLGTVFEAMAAMLHAMPGAPRLVLFGMVDPELVRQGFAHMDADVSVVSADLAGITAAADWRESLYLTDHEGAREVLLGLGIDAARVFLWSEWYSLFRINGLPEWGMRASGASCRLSIGVVVDGDAGEFAALLDHLAWSVAHGAGLEILVVDAGQDAGVEGVARERGAGLPGFRYLRRPPGEEAWRCELVAMQAARGRYVVRMGVGDRLMPEALMAELAHLDRHGEILASHGVAGLEEGWLFGAAEAVELFNAMVHWRLDLARGILRREAFCRVLCGLPGHHAPFIVHFQVLAQGKVRLHPGSCYRVIGACRAVVDPEGWRGALDVAAALALSHIGGEGMTEASKPVFLNMVNASAVAVLEDNARVAQGAGDRIALVETLRRLILWEEDAQRKDQLRAWALAAVGAAVMQAVGEIFALFTDARRLVLCGLAEPDPVREALLACDASLPVTVWDPVAALAAADWEGSVYVVESESVQRLLLAAGVEAGRVMVLSDLIFLFRSGVL